MDKASLKAELLAGLLRELETCERAHAAALEGAVHEEARAEHEKDTRALEQSYIARGQARRVAELRQAIAETERLPTAAPLGGARVAIGAVVTLEDAATEASSTIFIAPHCGGAILAGSINVVTPGSPLGAALLGREVDDECVLDVGGRQRTLVVTRID